MSFLEGLGDFGMKNQILRQKLCPEPAGKLWKPKCWLKNVKKGIFFKKNNTILVTEEMEDVLCNMLLKLIQIKLNYSIDVKIYRRRDLIPKESLLKFKGSSFRNSLL